MEEGAEKWGPRTGEAQNASGPNANTLWRRHAARPSRRSERMAHLRHRYEEVDGGVVAPAKQVGTGWGGGESAWGRDAAGT